jgi:glycerate 2-kinase
MHILIAPDSYKGSLSAVEASEAIRKGLRTALPDATYTLLPMADGGEGTMDALLYGLNGEKIHLNVRNPLGHDHLAPLALNTEKKMAIIEVASIVGLPLLDEQQLQPLATTTFGIGPAIHHALEKGARHFIVGLGGSATNDGGVGMLEALGVRFYRKQSVLKDVKARDLHYIDRVDLSGLHPLVKEATFTIASDVDNPLCGERGATAVFGPQKGATQEIVERLDTALANYAILFPDGYTLREKPGAGAAGGLGFAFMLLGGKLSPGAEIVSKHLDMDRAMQEADLFITGEGKTDRQTLYGKAPYYLAQKAKNHGKPVLIISGSLGNGYEALQDDVDAFFSVVPGPVSVQEAIQYAEHWVEQSARQVGRVIRLSQSLSASQK